MRHIFVSLFLSLIFCTVTAVAGDNAVLARIGDKQITEADFKRIASYYDPEKQRIIEQNPQAKATLYKRIIQGMVISKIAKDEGFDSLADIREQMALLTDDFLSTEYIKRKIIANINVTDDDANIFYKAHMEDFMTPEMIRARHILIKVDKSASDEDKKRAKENAEEILNKIKRGEDFTKLALEFSDDRGSKKKGGDLGFFTKGKMVPDFEKVAFSLKPGEISNIFETPFGLHIVRVEERKEAEIEPFDKAKNKAKEMLIGKLRKARIEEFIEKAFKDAKVELNSGSFIQEK
jgi:peptidyl-prolyl cis-trans isomerase C